LTSPSIFDCDLSWKGTSKKPWAILISQIHQNFIENITISGNVVISSETEESLADYEKGLDGVGRKKTIISFKIS